MTICRVFHEASESELKNNQMLQSYTVVFNENYIKSPGVFFKGFGVPIVFPIYSRLLGGFAQVLGRFGQVLGRFWAGFRGIWKGV